MVRCLKVVYTTVYVLTFTLKTFHTNPDDGSRGRKE